MGNHAVIAILPQEWAYNSEDFYYYMCFSAPGPFDGDWKPADEYVVGNEETCSCTARKKP